MDVTKAFAPIAAVGVVAAGIAGTPVVAKTHADLTLLADTAIFVGGTMLTTPSATFAHTAADLYLKPLGFDEGDDATVCVIGSAGCDSALQVLTTPELFMQGHSAFAGAAEIVRAVHAELEANPDTYDADNPLWIFGYSQGATAGSIAMAQLAHEGIDPQSLHFVFIGNPNGEYGVWSDPAGASTTADLYGMLNGFQTPNDAFTTTVYAFPGDPVADYRSESDLGLFWEHVMYLGLTPEEVANQTFSTDGMITNIDISDDIDPFTTWFTAITSGGLIDSGVWVGLFNSIVEVIYSGFDKIEEFFTDWMGIDWGGVEDTLDVWFPAV
ncbi:PE-PPE domain-containing protein [[Mycobacterium] kokjensenii]|uniref:PE-PPE domain-containing protein n=1 Tax=[Mycobacterium] kokjensenii TaxID=3064287 RepID=A0ABM9LX66_9MYCO|nr:PE-PPE domain-containing protein [Mycolicibacter sp. MU0083]CAJ1506232.1 PE-PPE domain-containing protein [Mycolicibacter sp. MU0083]